jgi:hypothetical protein
MEDLFAALFAAFAEIFFEALFELFCGVIGDLTVRFARGLVAEVRTMPPILASVGYLSFGVIAGSVSVLVFPHPLVHPSRFHGISILVSPLITGLVMSQVGVLLRRRGRQSIRIESFGYGFAFAFGMALIRFLFTQ